MKLVIIEPLGVQKDKLLKLADDLLGSRVEIEYYDTRTEKTDDLVKRAKDADIIALSNLPFRKEVLENCPRLKLISVAFTGVDHVDMEYCRQQGIMVCNSSGYSNEAVSELVFGLALALYRKIIPCDAATRNEGTKNGLTGYELAGKKMGIVGTGAIGMKTARLAKAFGMEVYAYSRTQKETDFINYVSLDELLSTSDVVSLHVPLNNETRGLLDKEKIAHMKSNAILINLARGPVVDRGALADALKAGKIAGAAVDVYENEPPIDRNHPLLNAPNVVATPHIGFATVEALEKRAVIVFDNIVKWLGGSPQNIM